MRKMKKLVISFGIFACACNPFEDPPGLTSSSSTTISTSTTSSSTNSSDSTSTSVSTSFSSTSTSTSTTSSDISSGGSSGISETCGNGILELNEECDDGNSNQLDNCSNSCENPRRIFISSYSYFGNYFKSAYGADDACNALASKINLSGTYKAWLSDSVSSPSERFNAAFDEFKGIYILMNDEIVAKNGWMDLTDGILDFPINVTEEKNMLLNEVYPWSNTKYDGTSIGEFNCSNWSDFVGMGHQGSSIHPNSFWTNWKKDACSKTAPIYCVED